MRWGRVLLVWGVACGFTLSIAWIMVALGAFDTDHPDPARWQDLLMGLGIATQSGLVLSLEAERRGPGARGGAALLMLPFFALLGATAFQAIRYPNPARAGLMMLGLATYSLQFWRLAAAPRVEPLSLPKR